MSLDPGTTLGPYEILSPLGAGGMGEVYRARDTRLGRDVAIKVLPQHLSATPEVRARFEREARTISSLNHPHICTLFDVGHEGDTNYLVMELLEGETLADRLLRGPLPTRDVLELGAQIADALDRAHREGVVHRDLKPGNVMLTKAGAKLLDFGLARSTGLSGSPDSGISLADLEQSPTIAAPLTAEGTIIGTFQYMPPEQLEGKEIDARSDIWALGCVLYEMATGKQAFEGRSQASLIAAILEHEPPPIPTLAPLSPPWLERIVRRCLAKDPDERWQSARDLAQELRWIGEGETLATGGNPAVPSSRAGKLLPWLLVAVLALATGASLLFALRGSHGSSTLLRFQELAYRPAAIFRAAFAPDGKTIVYSAAPEGNIPEIYTVRPEYPEPQSLGLHDTQLLSVSSKGELAVLINAQFIGHRLFVGTLARVSLGGGAPREILEDVREADWSPDGSKLAVIRDVNGTDQLEYPIGHILTQSGGYLSDLRISPRGDRIAYFEHPARYDDRGSVNVVDLKGKTTLLSDGYWGEEGIAWTSDGSEILYSASYGGYTWTVYAVNSQGKRRIALQSAGGLTIHDVAPDGRWLTSRDDQHLALMVHRPEWSQDRNLSWLDLSTDGMLSRDGNTLVFCEQSGAMGANYAVCLRKTDGSPVTRLGEGYPMALSRDGKWVLAEVPSTPPILWIYPTGAGTAQHLDPGELRVGRGDAWWLPNGESVVIDGRLPNEGPRYFLLDRSGGTPRPVTPEGTREAQLSDDGKRILAKGLDSKFAIYSLAGGAPAPVAGLTERDEVVHWSADEGSALVVRGLEIPLRLTRVDLTSGKREPFRDIAPQDRSGVLRIRVSYVSPDEESYSYLISTQISTLFIVERME